MLTPPRISNHAVRQYRWRALHCPERYRDDDVLRKVMGQQIWDHVEAQRCRKSEGGAFLVECGFLRPHQTKLGRFCRKSVSYSFVIEGQAVVTVLGYLMRENHKMMKRRARKIAAAANV